VNDVPIPYEPILTGLCAQGILQPKFSSSSTVAIMAPTTPPPLDFEHKKGFEIATKHRKQYASYISLEKC